MQTDKITIDNSGTGMEEALSEAERLADYLKAEKKEALQLRLLTEEALGMVRAVTGEFRGYLWLEASEKKDCRIHIETVGHVDYETKQGLISVSSSGKNESEKGFMRKLIALAERGLHGMEETVAQEQASMLRFGSLSVYEPEFGASEGAWSLAAYRDNLEQRVKDGTPSTEEDEALDELEKSIVASIADDVKVYVRKDGAEIVIEKSF